MNVMTQSSVAAIFYFKWTYYIRAYQTKQTTPEQPAFSFTSTNGWFAKSVRNQTRFGQNKQTRFFILFYYYFFFFFFFFFLIT